MPQSLACLIVHIVFSTQGRIPLISVELEARLRPFLCGILRSEGCRPLAVGGTDDHIHALTYLSRTISISQLVGNLKSRSSRWVRDTFQMRRKFGWQGGYAAFSVSPSEVECVTRYIDNQRAHHRGQDFQEELRDLLRGHEIAFDERHIWD